MRHPLVFIATFSILACQVSYSSQPPPPEPEPEPEPVAVEEADDDGAVSPPTSACLGDESGLDLSALTVETCPVDDSPLPPPEGAVKTFLSPSPLDLAGFGRGDLKVAVVNVTGEPLTFDLALGCGPWHGLDLRAIPESGGDGISFAPVELHEGELVGYCAKAARCGLRTLRITLTASGRAFVPLTLDLRSRSFDEHCALEESPPLPEGRYTLEAAFPNTEGIPAGQGGLRVSG